MTELQKRYDIVIIGGGLGGLTAGAKLAKEGKSVLLLEQHSVAGGCATTFRHGDFRIEVGLHEMDGLKGGNFKQKIFADLEILNRVVFLEVPHFYRVVMPGTDITIPHDTGNAEAMLIQEFPDEEKGIGEYFFRIKNFRKYHPETETEQSESVGTFLDRITGNERLKLILLGNLMAFTDDPYLLAMDYYAQAQGTFYQSGGVFIQGGSQMLSDHLVNFIRQHSGTVVFRHLSQEIIVRDNRCVAVRFRDIANGSEHLAEAGQVIANACLPQVAEQLLPVEYGRQIIQTYSARTPGASLFTLYLAFDKPLKELGNPAYCTCVYGPDIETQRDIGPNSRGVFENKTFVLTDYSHIDSRLAPIGKSVAAMVAEDYLSYWKHMDRKAYLQRKKEVTLSFIDRLENLLPGMKKHLVWYDSATAKTIERYTLNTAGAVYGFAQLPGLPARPKASLIPNLWFASAWDKFGGGFSAVIYSGYFTAMDILRKERMNSK